MSRPWVSRPWPYATFLKVLQEINRAGTTILLVEQNANMP